MHFGKHTVQQAVAYTDSASCMCNPSCRRGPCDSSFVNQWSSVFQWRRTASRYRLFKCSIGERLKFMQGHWGCDNYNHRFLAWQWQPFVIFTWVIPAAWGCWQACTDLVACRPLLPDGFPPTASQPELNQTWARDWHSPWDKHVALPHYKKSKRTIEFCKPRPLVKVLSLLPI